MTMVLIAANRAATLATEDPVIPAASIDRFHDAAGLIAAAGRLHDAIDADRSARLADATAAGRAEGLAAGQAAAAEEAALTLIDLNRRVAEALDVQRADVSRLALEVVRRIAGSLGDDATVAALAERAAQDLAPDAVATVRVAPAARDATEQRLRDFAGLTVVGDGTLAPTDCVIETPLGASHAGLEIQIAGIERAWRANGGDDAR